MGIKNDIVKTTVLMDGKQSLNELGKLELELSEIRQQMKALKRDSDDYNTASKKLRSLQKDIRARRKELGIEGMTLQQLVRYQKDLRREITNTTTRGTKEYRKLTAELNKVTAAVTRQRLEMRGMAGAWVKLGQSVKQSLTMFGPVALITSLIYGLSTAIRTVARDNISLSDTMADVQKNTELTNDELAVLMDRLMKINTRSSRQELLELVTIGGKLGIRGVQDLEGFARAADKINVALGEDLGGDPISTLGELGKLTNTFGLKKKMGIEDSLLRVGSVLNDLGRSSEANEEHIADFTKRLGGVAPVAGITIQEIMGIGAAADLLGLSMEVSGTAMSQVIGKMVKERRKYVQFAKDTEGNQLSLEQFTNLLNTDANAALLSVLNGLKGNDEALTDFVDSLGDMGLEGQRVIQVISALATNVDKVEEQQRIANDAFKEGTSVLEEFEQKNNTAGANLDKIGKKIKDNFINSGMVRWLERVTAKMVKFIEVPVSETIRKEQVELNNLVGAISRTNENQEVRNGLIEKLRKLYPDFLGDLEDEQISNEVLKNKLADVNAEYQKKIILELSREKVNELLKEEIALIEEKLDLQELTEEADNPNRGAILKEKEALIELNNELKNHKELIQQHESSDLPFDGQLYVDQILLERRIATQKELIASLMGFDSDVANYNAAFWELESQNLDKRQQDLDERLAKAKSRRKALLDELGIDDISKGTPPPTVEDNDQTKNSSSANKREEFQIVDPKQINTEVEKIRDATMELIDLDDTRTGKALANSEKRQEQQAKERELMQEMIMYQVESGMQAGLQAESWKEAGEIMKQQLRELIIGEISRAISIQITKALMSLPIPPPFNLAIATGMGVAAGAAINQTIPSFYYGGEVGETGHGMGTHGGDQNGNFSGMYATHGGEFVTPSWVRGYPDVQAAIGVTKARMNGVTMTTPPAAGSVSVTSSLDASGMDAVAQKMEVGVAMFADAVNVLREHGISAKISKRESAKIYETAKEEYNKKEKARNRGSI